MKLSKKILVGTMVFLSAASIASAAKYKEYKGYKGVAPCPTLRDGFYIGLQAGYDSYNVKERDNLGVATARTILGPTGWVGGAFAGYGMNFDLFYLGGEIFINDSAAQGSNNFNNTVSGVSGSQKFTVNTSYGLAFLPGIKLTSATLSYIRLGYNWANLKVTEAITGTTDNFSASATNTSHGFVFGLGIETLVPEISDHVSIRGEYSYTYYSSFTPSGGQIKFTPSDSQFMFSVIYHV